MKTTTNFGLKKPEDTDPVEIQDFNDNADIIDREIALKADKTGDGSNLTTKFSQSSELTNLVSGEKLSTSLGKMMKAITDLMSHINNKSNPHGVTKAQVGLGNAENTSDVNKPVSVEQQAALDKKVASAGGDIANTKVSGFTASTASYPVPAPGETPKVFMGKIVKFFADTRNWMTGVCLIGSLVNNCVTNRADLPLSAAQGKVLMDLYNVLNTKLSEQKVLWSHNGWVMHAEQTVLLSEKISSQKNGIVLCWTAFSPETNTVETYDNHYFFVPKEHVLNRPGAGVDMMLSSQGIDNICCKYVYITDTNIIGHDRNSASGVSRGISWDSKKWVLRKVLGV